MMIKGLLRAPANRLLCQRTAADGSAYELITRDRSDCQF